MGCRGAGTTLPPLPPKKRESNTGHKKKVLILERGQRGHRVHAELQMVLCQEIADKDNCALLEGNWK